MSICFEKIVDNVAIIGCSHNCLSCYSIILERIIIALCVVLKFVINLKK